MDDGCMNDVCGGGDILYFPSWRDFDRRVKDKKLVVIYFIGDEDSPASVTASRIEPSDNGTDYFELRGYTKHWAMKQLLKDKSPWVVRH